MFSSFACAGGKWVARWHVHDHVSGKGMSTDMADHAHIAHPGLCVLEKFAVEEGPKDAASHVTAAVAADEDGGFCDGLGQREGGWRIGGRWWAERLIAEIAGGDVVEVGEGFVDVGEV